MPPPSPPPSPSLFLMQRLVDTYPPGFDTPNIRGRLLTSGDKLAFGFRANADANSVVRDLDLEAVLTGATDPFFLILRGGNLFTGIHTVDKDLVLISSAFPEVHSREVFLIYNAMERSLHMIPSMPRTDPPAFRTAHVLVARLHDDDKSYALVYPGQKLGKGRRRPSQDVLFVAHSSSASPWETVKKVKVPDHLRSNGWFVAGQVFSSRGRGYWVDLLVGILYCDCADVMSDGTDWVKIYSLELPVGCERYLDCKDNIAEASAFRSMGPVGDSIKFISIDGYIEHVDLKDCTVRVWRLMEHKNWAVEYELKLSSLWYGGEFSGNYYMVEFLTPMYPFLSTHEDHVIYFAMGYCRRGKEIFLPGDVCFMTRVDLRRKTFHCTRLSEWQRKNMASYVAVSGNAEGKLLGLQLSAIPSVS